MVTVLQLNRLELKEMITQEIVENPVLEESTEDSGEEITPEELMPLLEGERALDPKDHLLENAMVDSSRSDGAPGDISDLYGEAATPETARPDIAVADGVSTENVEPQPRRSFDEIDFGSFFDDYLDPGYKPGRNSGKPSFETFLLFSGTCTTISRSQLSISVLPDRIRESGRHHHRQPG
jgi:RNA polymerase sigma-54 factor